MWSDLDPLRTEKKATGESGVEKIRNIKLLKMITYNYPMFHYSAKKIM